MVNSPLIRPYLLGGGVAKKTEFIRRELLSIVFGGPADKPVLQSTTQRLQKLEYT